MHCVNIGSSQYILFSWFVLTREVDRLPEKNFANIHDKSYHTHYQIMLHLLLTEALDTKVSRIHFISREFEYSQ